MPNILFTNYYKGRALEIIRSIIPSDYNVLLLSRPGREEILKLIPQADYLIAGGRTKVDHELLKNAKRLRMVQRSGAGLDSIDLQYLRLSDIPLYVNRGVNAKSVAEHTVLLILSVLRKLTLCDHSVRKGKWEKHELGLQSRDLGSKSVGLIGLGKIGEHVSKLIRAFGSEIFYFDIKRIPKEEEQKLSISYLELDELLKRSDIISLHCPLTDNTLNLVDKEFIEKMKQNSIIVNTARGKLIVEEDLAQALISNRISGAGLDVFYQEPVSDTNPFKSLENVIMTPHVGGVSYDSFSKIISSAFENINLHNLGKVQEIEHKRVY